MPLQQSLDGADTLELVRKAAHGGTKLLVRDDRHSVGSGGDGASGGGKRAWQRSTSIGTNEIRLQGKSGARNYFSCI
jgi:hypothetical protein